MREGVGKGQQETFVMCVVSLGSNDACFHLHWWVIRQNMTMMIEEKSLTSDELMMLYSTERRCLTVLAWSDQ
jgi:hypothetical protein